MDVDDVVFEDALSLDFDTWWEWFVEKAPCFYLKHMPLLLFGYKKIRTNASMKKEVLRQVWRLAKPKVMTFLHKVWFVVIVRALHKNLSWPEQTPNCQACFRMLPCNRCLFASMNQTRYAVYCENKSVVYKTVTLEPNSSSFMPLMINDNMFAMDDMFVVLSDRQCFNLGGCGFHNLRYTSQLGCGEFWSWRVVSKPKQSTLNQTTHVGYVFPFIEYALAVFRNELRKSEVCCRKWFRLVEEYLGWAFIPNVYENVFKWAVKDVLPSLGT